MDPVAVVSAAERYKNTLNVTKTLWFERFVDVQFAAAVCVRALAVRPVLQPSSSVPAAARDMQA